VDLRVVLVASRNPLNIGAAARAMSNFGFPCLRLVNAYEVAFREAKSAVGAGAVLETAEVFGTLENAIADCRLVVGTTSASHRELKHPIWRLEQGARLIRRHAGPVALLFGSEKFGLANEDMDHCHWLLRIPTRAGHPSMNLGQSVSVCLYELIRGRGASRSKPTPSASASAEELERLTVSLLDALEKSGYLKSPTSGSMTGKLRRLIRRMNLSTRDSTLLQGMVRQILWRLGTRQD
jgi:tRNA/rRNA methyltransferase